MIRVIGIGSGFGDDSMGWQCLDAIKSALLQNSMPVEIHYCASPGTQLIHQLHPTATNILVDALNDEAHVAQVLKVEAKDLQNSHALSSHDISVANVLELAARLKCLPARLHILGIGMDIRTPLTEAQRCSVTSQLLTQISNIISRYSERNGDRG